VTVFEKSKCWSCGSTLQGWDVAVRGIGVPFLKCSHCGSFNDRSKQINEWDLMPKNQKDSFAYLTLYWGLGMGVALTIPIAFLSIKIWPEIERAQLGGPSTWIILGLALSISYVGQYFFVRREIQKSRERIADPKIFEILKRLYPDKFVK
jgi:hypothetical protein